MSDQRPETISLRGGQTPDPTTDDMVRQAVGIEHIDDILSDPDRAFARVAQAVSA